MLQNILIYAPPLILAVVLHEIAHGYVAFLLGDPTAKRLGRLSLNPLRHIDPMMTIILPGILLLLHSPVLFGGAKPVPINPLYFKNPRYGIVLVAIAGPITNIILAALSFGILVLINRSTSFQEVLPAEGLFILLMWCLTGVLTNLVLAIFNLIPIPPLDGGKIAMGLLPHPLALLLSKLESFGLILLFLLLSTGGVSDILSPVINFATKGLCSELYSGDAISQCPFLKGTSPNGANTSVREKSVLKNSEPSSVKHTAQGTQI